MKGKIQTKNIKKKNKENIDRNVWTIRNRREWLNHALYRGFI